MKRLRQGWLAIVMLCALAMAAFATDDQQNRGQDDDRRPRRVVRVPKENENQEQGNSNTNRGNDNDRNRENRDRGRRP